jgi:hypothetical protein
VGSWLTAMEALCFIFETVLISEKGLLCWVATPVGELCVSVTPAGWGGWLGGAGINIVAIHTQRCIMYIALREEKSETESKRSQEAHSNKYAQSTHIATYLRPNFPRTSSEGSLFLKGEKTSPPIRRVMRMTRERERERGKRVRDHMGNNKAITKSETQRASTGILACRTPIDI